MDKDEWGEEGGKGEGGMSVWILGAEDGVRNLSGAGVRRGAGGGWVKGFKNYT